MKYQFFSPQFQQQMHINMDKEHNNQKMDYFYESTVNENESFYLNHNDSVIPEIVPMSLTSAIFFSISPKSNTSSGYNSTNSGDQFQFYIIGIYSFFAIVFGFGIIVILFKKFQQACCSSPMTECPDYESVPHRECLSPQDNPAFEHPVNVNYLDVDGRNNGHDSDYEYYSDNSNGEKDMPKDKPPAYEDPPSYSILLQH